MTSVFLSYARADDDPNYDDPAVSFMRRLYIALTAAGFRVWWDRESLPARSLTFTHEIEDAIRDCDRFVLVAGPGAVASEYVRAEWRFALEGCKPITPILRAGDYDLIPAAVAEINAVDCRPSRDEAAALGDLIARLNEAAPLGDPIGVRDLPRGYITRPEPFDAARDALCADAIRPTIISAPPSAVALYGLGGIGKSTLAAALARDCQIRRHFRDGILWIEVGREPSVAGLQASIGVHFGDSRDNYPDERDGALSLSRILRDKAALILLDDVWDHRIVERFPVSGTACRLLITTRSGALAGRVQGADIRLNLLTPEEGARLVAARTGGDPADPDYRRISQRLGGHTLAVSLAAAQIAEGYADSAADLLRLIDKRREGPEPFRDLALDEADKDLNLAHSLSLSYDALPSDDLRRRFRALGALAIESTVDRAALAALWGDADADDARGPLKTLEGVGLLDSEGGRWGQHGLLRAYARALLREHDEFDAVSARHFDHFRALHGDYDANNDEDRHPQIAVDFANLGVALDWGFTHQSEAACDLIWALNYYMLMRESLVTQRALLEPAVAAAQASGYALGEANTLRALGALRLREDDLAGARAAYEAALPLYQTIGDRLGEANTLWGLGQVRLREDDLAGARAAYEAALPLYQTIGDRLGEANTLRALGDLSTHEHDFAAAERFYSDALSLYRVVGDGVGQLNTLRQLAVMNRQRGDLEAAKRYFQQCLDLADRIPAYANHPVIQGWRREYQALLDGEETASKDDSD